MNEIVVKDNVKIENMIFEVRGKQVILDSNLAKLYKVETKRINEAVKRNLEKFPERYTFILSDEEIEMFLVANCDQKIETRGGRYKNPRVFTEQGVAMLSTILKSSVAIKVSISIMDAFVSMKKYISNNLLEQNYIKDMVIRHDEEIKLLQNTFSKFDTFSNEIFFDGQIWDAHSLLLDIFNSSKISIVIIDNYISKELLDVVCKTNKQITIYTKNMDNNMINKNKSQYNNLDIHINDKIHDRFIIIDGRILYHSGASFKDLSKKCFAINRIEDNNILKELKNRLSN